MRKQDLADRASAYPTTLAAFLELPGDQRLSLVTGYRGIAAPTSWRIARFVAFSRPRTCIPGALAFYFATVICGGVSVTALIVGLVVSYHIAAIANLYNMYTDIVEDNENIPSRIFELGLYGRERLLRHTHLLTAAILALSLLVNWYFAGLTLLALIGCQQYSFRPFRMKMRPRIGILYFANAVTYPYISAALASPEQLAVFLDPGYTALAVYLCLWFCAKGLIKNVPDYDGDKRVNVTTSATLSATRRNAAIIAAIGTVLVYAGIAVPVVLGFIEPKYLIALVWLPVACFQAWRLVYSSDQQSWNNMLRDDMFVSVGYLATLVLIEQFSVAAIAVVVAGFAIMILSDRLGLDTRRKQDFGST